MHGRVFGNPQIVTRELQGRFVPERDKIVTPGNWVIGARAYWPNKTAAHLASIAGKDERTAKRWLAGEFEPPKSVIAALIAEMLK